MVESKIDGHFLIYFFLIVFLVESVFSFLIFLLNCFLLLIPTSEVFNADLNCVLEERPYIFHKLFVHCHGKGSDSHLSLLFGHSPSCEEKIVEY